MLAPTQADWKEALDLIEELMIMLTKSDPRACGANLRPVQEATDLLNKHGRGRLPFPRGARLPTSVELANLYSRADVRACLGWSDDKLRRRLEKLRDVRPSGTGRGQQFTGADVVALYRGGIACQPERSTRDPVGMSGARTGKTVGSRTSSRSKSLLRQLLDE